MAAHGQGNRPHGSRQGRWLVELARPRSVLVDGTTFTMPDTAENQLAYPQVDPYSRGLASPSCEPWRWFRWRPAPLSIWHSQSMPARELAKTSLFREMMGKRVARRHRGCRPILPVLFRRWPCSRRAASTWFRSAHVQRASRLLRWPNSRPERPHRRMDQAAAATGCTTATRQPLCPRRFRFANS